MFTGLIETRGILRSIRSSESIINLSIQADLYSGRLLIGESVCVSGVCLSVTGSHSHSFEVDMMPETYGKTTLGKLQPGDRVNLERSLTVGSRLDGHFVTGHVDGTARVISIEHGKNYRVISFETDKEISRFLVQKGSVAIDGTSLTVIQVSENSFSVGIIPITLENTTLGMLNEGNMVNVETDVLSKYVLKAVSSFLLSEQSESTQHPASEITWSTLKELGWR